MVGGAAQTALVPAGHTRSYVITNVKEESHDASMLALRRSTRNHELKPPRHMHAAGSCRIEEGR